MDINNREDLINLLLAMKDEARRMYELTKDEDAFSAYISAIDAVRCIDAFERGETEADGEDIIVTIVDLVIASFETYYKINGYPAPNLNELMNVALRVLDDSLS